MDDATRRSRYDALRTAKIKALRELFDNPADAPIEILFEDADIAAAEDAAAAMLVEEGRPASWSRTGVVFEDMYGITLRDAVRKPDGLGTYVRRVNPGNAPGVVILPLCAGKVVLVRHFRHSTRRWHLEVPRGFGTPGSSPEDDARRELKEEIDAEPAKPLESLGVVYPDTGQMATPVRLYCAEITHYRAADRAEGITAIQAVSPAEFARLIRDGEIDDGFTISAYARAVLMRLLPAVVV